MGARGCLRALVNSTFVLVCPPEWVVGSGHIFVGSFRFTWAHWLRQSRPPRCHLQQAARQGGASLGRICCSSLFTGHRRSTFARC